MLGEKLASEFHRRYARQVAEEWGREFAMVWGSCPGGDVDAMYQRLLGALEHQPP